MAGAARGVVGEPGEIGPGLSLNRSENAADENAAIRLFSNIQREEA